MTGSVDTSINLGGVFVEEGGSGEVYIGGGAGISAGKLPGCYDCVNTSGDARRLLGSNPELMKGALSLPSMSDEAALINMPELFDGATGHHPVIWDVMENVEIEGVTYKYYSDKGCKKEISASKVKNAGTYYVKATVAADQNYRSATSAAAKIIISKAAQELKVTQTKSQKTIKLKAADVKKKAQTIPFSKVAKVTGNKTKLTYKKVKGASAFKVDPGTGKITVKKGTKKNTYMVKIIVTAEADNNYKSDSGTVTVKIKIG